jgi:inner membrane protein
MMQSWIIWLIVAALFLAGEVLTTGFFLLWFGVGAIVAALLALLGINGFALQIVAFLTVSILLVIASRTIFERFPGLGRGRHLKTGVEKMIGEVGTVVEPSTGERSEAAVKVYGSVWTAFPCEGEDPLTAGETVRVDRVDGNVIYVYRSGRPGRRALLFDKSS